MSLHWEHVSSEFFRLVKKKKPKYHLLTFLHFFFIFNNIWRSLRHCFHFLQLVIHNAYHCFLNPPTFVYDYNIMHKKIEFINKFNLFVVFRSYTMLWSRWWCNLDLSLETTWTRRYFHVIVSFNGSSGFNLKSPTFCKSTSLHINTPSLTRLTLILYLTVTEACWQVRNLQSETW